MEPDTQELDPRQKELVAVGASVGAGCHPCLNHHLNAGARAGLESGHLLAAVASAEGVASEATVLVADHAREKLGASTAATLTPLEETLAAFGAALGANDAAAIDLLMRSALDSGASRSQLHQAIETAKTVQEHAGRIHVRNAERLLDEIAPASAVAQESPAGEGCGCGGDDASESTPQAHEPRAESNDRKDDTAGGASFKPPMADCFASAGNGEVSGPAAMIAHCKEMFAGLFGEPGEPATTEEPPTAHAAKGCSTTKEV